MSTVAFKIFKETVLPGALEPHAVYLIAPAAKPDYIEMYVTNADASVVKRIINESDIQTMINAAVTGLSSVTIVADIAARDALTPTTTSYVYVEDATGDPSVLSGGATYLYNPTTTSWIKTSEAESLDISLTWAALTGKPTSTPAQIDSAVANSHTHANMTELGKIGESGGNLTYNGGLPVTGWNSTGW